MGKEVELDEDPSMVTFVSRCHHCHDDDSDPEMSQLGQDLIDHIGLWHHRRLVAPRYSDDDDDDDDDDDYGYSDMPPLEEELDTDIEEYFNHREPEFFVCVEHGHNFGFHIVPLEGAPSVFIHCVLFLVSHSYLP